MLIVIAMLWGVPAQERPGTMHAASVVEALRLTTGDIVRVAAPLVTDVPAPDPENDGRWWALLRTARGWERWDGPYYSQELCADDINGMYADQHPRRHFACAEEVSDGGRGGSRTHTADQARGF